MLIGRSSNSKWVTRVYHAFRRRLRKSNSVILGNLARQILRTNKRFTGRIPSGATRSLASTCQPLDPLRRSKPKPAIDVAIPFVEKDLPCLELVISGVIQSVTNPIGNFYLVTPGDSAQAGPSFGNAESFAMLEVIRKRHPHLELRFDRQVLGPRLASGLLNHQGLAADGWRVQQLIKYVLARRSRQSATLIVDADTVLLQSKTWLGKDGTQLLQFSEEYHQPYMNHFKTYFGIEKTLPVSFVTHHQLMQKDVVKEMFPRVEDLLKWVQLGSQNSKLKISEYETYGTYLLTKYPHRVRFGTWSNLWSPHLDLVKKTLSSREETLQALLPDYCSVSFHSHSQSAIT